MMIANGAKLHQEGYEIGVRFSDGTVEFHKTVKAADFARRKCGDPEAEVVFRAAYFTDWTETTPGDVE